MGLTDDEQSHRYIQRTATCAVCLAHHVLLRRNRTERQRRCSKAYRADHEYHDEGPLRSCRPPILHFIGQTQSPPFTLHASLCSLRPLKSALASQNIVDLRRSTARRAINRGLRAMLYKTPHNTRERREAETSVEFSFVSEGERDNQPPPPKVTVSRDEEQRARGSASNQTLSPTG